MGIAGLVLVPKLSVPSSTGSVAAAHGGGGGGGNGGGGGLAKTCTPKSSWVPGGWWGRWN